MTPTIPFTIVVAVAAMVVAAILFIKLKAARRQLRSSPSANQQADALDDQLRTQAEAVRAAHASQQHRAEQLLACQKALDTARADQRALAERHEKDRREQAGHHERKQQEQAVWYADELRQQRERYEAQLDTLRDQLRTDGKALSKADSDVQHLTDQLADCQATLEALRADHRAQTAQLHQKREALVAEQKSAAHLREQIDALGEQERQRQELMRSQFEGLAQQLLRQSSDQLRSQHGQELGGLLAPLREQLQKFEQQVGDTYEKTLRDTTSLRTQVTELARLNQQLGDEAATLTRALRGEQKTQGNWGEMILKTVLEKSGLVCGEHFSEQVSVTNERGQRQQPDVVVNLPEGRHLVIDAKVSLNAYTDFVNGEEAALGRHCRALGAHIGGLGRKDYARAADFNTPDFVLMFVPVEAAFAAAVQHDPTLYEKALRQDIVVVTPTTLLATLRTVATLWQHEQQRVNVREIADRGGKLYDKFVGFVDSLDLVGKHLGQAQRAHEDALGKLSRGKGNLVRQAEQLRALGVPAKKQLPPSLAGGQSLTS